MIRTLINSSSTVHSLARRQSFFTNKHLVHSISPGDRCENDNQRETFPGKDERFFSREHQSMEVKEAPLVLYEIHNMTNI